MAFRRATSVLALALVGCASAPHFPLKAPLTRDADETPFAQAPEEYYSPFAWDGANYMVFHPIARFFAVDPAGAATNVNALDEVPDSSWFANRIGARAMDPGEAALGPAADGHGPPIPPLRVVHAVLPHLRRGTAKKILNITSGMGSIEDNTSGGR